VLSALRRIRVAPEVETIFKKRGMAISTPAG
jgi:hypothetical protein